MRRLLPVLSLLTLGACYKTHLVNYSSAPEPTQEVRVVRVWNHAVIAGFVPLSETDVRAACGGGEVVSVTTKMTIANIALNLLTGAIYSLTTADIVCKY